MSARPEKHSLTLRGHRTSVSLEQIFWREFCRIAASRDQPLNQLAAEIDAARGDIGLASAIRVFVLQEALTRQGPDGGRESQIKANLSA